MGPPEVIAENQAKSARWAAEREERNRFFSQRFAMPPLNILRLKRDAGTLRPEDLDMARGQVEQWHANRMIRSAGPGADRFYSEARAIYNQIKNMIDEPERRRQAEELAEHQRQAPPPTPVNININGASTRVNVATPSDAQALQGVLNQLASQAQRATI